MNRNRPTLRVLLVAAALFGQLAATSVARPTSLTHPATQDESTRPLTSAEPETDPFADVDVRRDPDTNELNPAPASKRADLDTSRALSTLRADAPNEGARVRVTLNAAGHVRVAIDDDGPLTKPAYGTPTQIARRFLARNAASFGMTADDVRSLKATMTHLDADSGATFLKFEERVGGVPVFDSEISVSVTRDGEVITATAGQLLDHADAAPEPTLTRDEAVAKAFGFCGATVAPESIVAKSASSRDDAATYANPVDAEADATVASRVLVNVGGRTRVAYRVSVDTDRSFDTLVDATTGELLYRHDLGADAHGMVYQESPLKGARTDEQFAPRSFAGSPTSDPWLTGTITTGNNVDAYLDTDSNDKPDAFTTSTLYKGRARAFQGVDFDFPFSPTDDARIYKAAAVTNLFYSVNVMHDWMYALGFNESARNMQSDNKGRGGSGGDAVLAESQDSAKTDNSRFTTKPEGQQSRMEIYFRHADKNNPKDYRGGEFDSDVVYHEYGHGVSNRLIGNTTGLTGLQSRAMGEGWSDYWAFSAYGDGVMAAYYDGSTIDGWRRTAYDGGPNAINGNYSNLGDTNFEVHDDGEVWAQTLVAVWNALGKDVTDRLVLNGMMHTSVHPSMLDARDGILAADTALYGGAHTCSIWKAFAAHGMGYRAVGNDDKLHNHDEQEPPTCTQSSDVAQILTTDGHGHVSELAGYSNFRSDWAAIVPGAFDNDARHSDLLFYEPSANHAEFRSTNGVGDLPLIKNQEGWNSGWDIVLPGNFGGDSHSDFFLYDRDTGIAKIFTTDGYGNITPLKVFTNFRHSWDIIVPGEFGGNGYTDLFFYDRAAGTGEFYTSDGNGNLTFLKSQPTLGSNWSLIVPGSFGGDNHTDLLLYDRAGGRGDFRTTDGSGNIPLLRTQSMRPSWDIIVAGSFAAGSTYADLLFYDRSAGFAQFYTTDGGGGIHLLNQYSDWRTTWDLIVPGYFSDSTYESLLFYQR